MPPLPRHERILVKLEEPPLGVLYRIAIGYAALCAYRHLAPIDASGWLLVAMFVSLLATLRVGPLFARKAIPFSAAVREVWSARRRLSKRYDSYQWQKLLWFGIGMICCASVLESVPAGGWLLSAFCVIAGGIGLFIWRRRDPTIRRAPSPPNRT